MVTLPPPPAAVNGGETAIGAWWQDGRKLLLPPKILGFNPNLDDVRRAREARPTFIKRPSGCHLESSETKYNCSLCQIILEDHQVGNDSDTLISGSVGQGGANQKDDVLIVQLLFNLISFIPENGTCTDELIDRIREFQLKRLKVKTADCRIDAKGRTLTTMLDLVASSDGIGRMGLSTHPDLVEKVEKFIGLAREARLQKQTARQKIAAPGGGVGKLTEANFAAAAEALKPGVQLAMILAFAEVESGGKSGFGPSGLPIIAYEGHIFRQYTKGKYDKSHPLLSHPYKKKAGPEWQANNKNQAAAWKTLNAAMELDHDAALKACSWGMFQVMGFNYETCGFTNVDEFVAKMKAGEQGQLDAFVGFCLRTRGLRKALADKNFVACATIYNGSDYGDYDKRIERAFKKYGGK
jgi:N-acetylmuramidase-like protein